MQSPCAVVELAEQPMAWCQDAAHDSPISMLRILAVGPLGSSYNSSMPAGHADGGWAAGSGMAVSGDEDGVVKVWDQRSRKQVMAYRKHTDFISDAALQPQEAALVVSSGDGTLSVHDLRACRLRARSETDADDELLSVAVMKGGKKVVAGCQSGALALFSWGCFKDCSDRFTGHPDSVDALVAFDEDTLLSGSSDGLLRVLGLLPNKLLGAAVMSGSSSEGEGEGGELAAVAHQRAEGVYERKREAGQGGSRRNASSQAYNILTLDYAPTPDGQALKQKPVTA
ncbi:predicted protein [Haematococcus lacustris]|uniref:Uncharacterized protein n=1 Tax=Haematococcus lacustris TaxID=44745 RepID=A0A699YFK0_HAELA|nr:predicted protein [Haematococcus lacustris]